MLTMHGKLEQGSSRLLHLRNKRPNKEEKVNGRENRLPLLHSNGNNKVLRIKIQKNICKLGVLWL